MPGAHRHGDSRFCGATTEVEGQGSVEVNDKLWAVINDPESHGEGRLKAVYGTKDVFIEDKLIIVAVGDTAGSDLQLHPGPPTDPSTSSGDVSAYD